MSFFHSEDDTFQVKPYTEVDDGKNKFYYTCLEWGIAEYSFKTCKVDDELRSPEFRCSNASWLLSVYPNGQKENESVGEVEIYLEKTNSFKKRHTVVSEITMAGNFKYENICKIKHTFKRKDSSCIFPSDVLRREVVQKNNGFLRNGYFVINCNLFVFKEESVFVSTVPRFGSAPVRKEVGTNSLDLGAFSTDLEASSESKLFLLDDQQDDVTAFVKDFETLHDNPRFADVILKVGEHEFPAHKLVLRSRSKVFEAMFEHDMQENRHDAVDLVTMDVDTVKDMLRFIYCGKIRQLPPEDAINLYVAADRYDLQGLVSKCRKIMLSNLSVDNVCEIAVVADMHDDQLLKNAVKSFLSKDTKEVLETEKWKMFSKENPVLSLSLIQSAILNK